MSDFMILCRQPAFAQNCLRGLLLCCLLLSGCAVTSPDSTGVPQIVQAAACSGDIKLSGRFSVRYQRNGKEEGLHGGFSWLQKDERTAIELLSPLGQTMAIIHVNPEGATLIEGGKPPRTALDADALANAELGWPLPVEGLREWLRGCAIDGSGRLFTASRQADRVTTQNGWRIRYVSWQEDAVSLLPRRIDLERGDVSLRLVIDRQPS